MLKRGNYESVLEKDQKQIKSRYILLKNMNLMFERENKLQQM